MNDFSRKRAENIEKYSWLCDPNLAEWIVNIIGAYGNSIIDVGCGNGFMFDYYKTSFKHVFGIDPNDYFSKMIKSNMTIQFTQAYAESIPCEDNSFDIAISKSSLHHFSDMFKGLNEMKRVSVNTVAIMEVIAPTLECIPFLKEILLLKENGRMQNSIFTSESLADVIKESINPSRIRQLIYDQYIDVGLWIEYGEIDDNTKVKIYKTIHDIDDFTKESMHVHIRGDRLVMLRRMCLCICDIS